MSNSSRSFLTLLVVPAVALGASVATAQTFPPAALIVERGASGLDVTPAQFRARRGGALLREAFESADADGNGALTQDEVDRYVAGQLTRADADADGAVALEEFGTLYAERTRDRMVDAFQRLDDDGDGRITGAELTDRFGSIVQRFDRNGDGALSPEDRRGRRGQGRDRGGRDRGDRG